MAENRFHSEEKIQYSRITPHIYIGTNLCCQVHGAALRKLGVEVDIDLEYRHAEVWERPSAEMILYLPTRDHRAPSPDKLIAGSLFIDAAVKLKKRIYAHCKNGHGRAPALVAAYLILKGMTVKAAIRFIQKKRPVVHLNREQMNALRSFARYLTKK